LPTFNWQATSNCHLMQGASGKGVACWLVPKADPVPAAAPCTLL